MFINEIISTDKFYIGPERTVQEAIDIINEKGCTSIPYIDDNSLLGILEKKDLESIDNKDALLHNSVQGKLQYLLESQHIYDALQYMSSHSLDILPIVDQTNFYLGYITLQSLTDAINSVMGNEANGAIIVLETGRHDSSFSHIAHLIELENSKILNMSARSLADSTKIEITIKVEKNRISSIISSLWRHDYVVKATFSDDRDYSDIKSRYDQLMNYLDL